MPRGAVASTQQMIFADCTGSLRGVWRGSVADMKQVILTDGGRWSGWQFVHRVADCGSSWPIAYWGRCPCPSMASGARSAAAAGLDGLAF